jgi:putative FmdB family regulatory protein
MGMPIYEYECEECNHCFERLVFGSEEESVACPGCGGRNVKRLISCASFIGESGMGACSPKPAGKFA